MNKRYLLHADDNNREAIRSNAISFIMNMSLDKSVEIIIRRYRKNKSDAQRGAFHFLCQTLGDQLGYSMNEIKELVKKDVYGTHEVQVGNKVFEVTCSSEKNEQGEPRTTDEYARLIDGVYRMAGYAGESLPALDPAYWLKKAG